MAGGLHFDLCGSGSGYLYRFGADIEVGPAAVHLVLVRVIRIDPLDVEILSVGCQVRDTPSDSIVMSDDHPRYSREREPGNIERTVITIAVQTDLVPDRRHLNAEMRVIGKNRQSSRSLRSRDDPVVRTDLRTRFADERVDQRDLVRGRAQQRREIHFRWD